jgi:hypothetical protein
MTASYWVRAFYKYDGRMGEKKCKSAEIAEEMHAEKCKEVKPSSIPL